MLTMKINIGIILTLSIISFIKSWCEYNKASIGTIFEDTFCNIKKYIGFYLLIVVIDSIINVLSTRW